MRLSDAIRLGAVLRPHIRGFLFWDGGSCALGAAAEAIGIPTYELDSGDEQGCDDHDSRYDELQLLFPILAEVFLNPLTYSKSSLRNLIPALNDIGKWSREQIADWVATLEDQQQPRTTQPERELALIALADGGRTMQPQSEQAVAILEIAGEIETA